MRRLESTFQEASYFSHVRYTQWRKDRSRNMTSSEDMLAVEIESWKGFEYVLREENRILFHRMLNECSKSEYAGCVNAKGENFLADGLFLILIYEEQKMINELMVKLRDVNYHRS